MSKIDKVEKLTVNQTMFVMDSYAFAEVAKNKLNEIKTNYFTNENDEEVSSVEVMKEGETFIPEMKQQKQGFVVAPAVKPKAPKKKLTKQGIEVLEEERLRLHEEDSKQVKDVESKEIETPSEHIKEEKVSKQPVVQKERKVQRQKVVETPILQKQDDKESYFTYSPISYGPSYVEAKDDRQQKSPKVEKVETVVADKKTEIRKFLSQELVNVLKDMTSSSLSSLDKEINKVMSYHSEDEIKQCSMFVSMLNAYLQLTSDGKDDDTVKRLYISMNKSKEYVMLVRIKEYLFGEFLDDLTNKVESKASEETSGDIRVLVNESLAKLNERHLVALENSKDGEIDLLGFLIHNYTTKRDEIESKFESLVSKAKIVYDIEKEELGDEKAQAKLDERIKQFETNKKNEISKMIKELLPDENLIEYEDKIADINKKYYGSKANLMDKGIIGRYKENLAFEMLKSYVIDLANSIYGKENVSVNKIMESLTRDMFVNGTTKFEKVSSDLDLFRM
ncbi:MAG: hypothetical protein KBT30_02180 [Clostridiales bacterium]|nr:hypothetical protein [Candidatus Apopatousia equi]